MARLLVAAGFKEVHCTPHCLKGMYETTPEQVRSGVAKLQTELDRAGIPLRLHPGMEYCLDEFFPAELDRLVPLGDSRLVLVEVPFQAVPELVRENIFQLRRRRYIPLVAHPERTPAFRPQPNPGLFKGLLNRLSIQNSEFKIQNILLADLREMGSLFQGNLGSFAGFYGAGVKKIAEAMRADGLYHCYGSDAHNPKQIETILNFEF